MAGSRHLVRTAALGVLLAALVAGGCLSGGSSREAGRLPPVLPDRRASIALEPEAARTHRAVMLQHLETVREIVAALAREDFQTAAHLTESHLGFFMHRQAMSSQRPDDFPANYHDLAMAHHQAAEDLAAIIPGRDLKTILPRLDGLLKACVACHLAYRVPGGTSAP